MKLLQLEPMPRPTETTMWRAARVLGLGLAVLLVILLPLLALGQDATAPAGDDLSALLGALVQAAQLSGPARWIGILIGGVMAAVYVLRKLGAKLSPGVARFVTSDEGGTLLNLVASASGALLVKLLAGTALSWPMVGAAFVAAAGGSSSVWSMGRRLLRLLSPLVRRIPKLGPALAAVLDVVSGANVKAEIAKETAVTYKPLAPTPTATEAAAQLSKPPAP